MVRKVRSKQEAHSGHQNKYTNNGATFTDQYRRYASNDSIYQTKQEEKQIGIKIHYLFIF